MDLQTYQVLLFLLIAIGIFYLFLPHETQIKYLPKQLAAFDHTTHQIIGGIALIAAVYLHNNAPQE